MMKKTILVVVLVLCGMAAFGQELPRIVILPLENRVGIHYDKEVETLTDILSTFINESLRVNVIDRFALDATMAAWRWRMEDWADNTKTAEMGRVLNASFILRGTVSQMGDNLIVSARILEIQTAIVKSSSNIQLEHLNEAYSKMNSLAQLLTYNLGAIVQQPVQPPAVTAPPPAPAAEPSPEQAQTQEPEPNNRPLQFHLTFFHFGLGMRMPMALDGSIELLKIALEHKVTGIGFGYRPFNLFGWFTEEDKKQENDFGYVYEPDTKEDSAPVAISVLNFSLYWNMMSLLNSSENFIFGPFVDINYLVMLQDIMFDKIMFSAGIQGGILRGDEIKSTILSIEIGFRLAAGFGMSDGARFFLAVKAGR